MPTILRVMLIYLVVAALSGGIAYLGNQLGRHVGRRKMSVFGMRPRHTSIFVTTVTGMMIALGTLTLAALFAEPVKLMLVGTEELEKRQHELTEQVAKLSDTVARGGVVWGIDALIFQGTIPPGIPAENVEEQLRSAIAKANLGTVIKYNDKALKMDVPTVPNDSVLLSYEPDVLRQMVERARSSPKAMGIRVVAARNYLLGDPEPLPVRFTLDEVKRIFRQGQVVARKTVDPHNPTFLMEWYQFLEEIKLTAYEKGMRDGPNGDLGFVLQSDEMNDLIQRIQQERGLATLVAVARKDLYDTSSLELQIEVHPGDSAHGSDSVARTR